MALFTRFSNGWQIAKASFRVLNEHKELIVFPILSGISIALILGSIIGGLFGFWGLDFHTDEMSSGMFYLLVFGGYVINYFIVVFFNMALMHCTKLYFDGEEVSVAKGLQFSLSRIHTIFAWAVFAATVGTLLKVLQDNLGQVGKIISGIIGVVWGIATFFVVPVLAYEKLGPVDAVKRSAELMKQKWGEGISANFSIALVCAAFFLGVAVLGMGLSALVNEQLGISIMVLGVLVLFAVGSALHSIFISALYHSIDGDLDAHFGKQLADSLFVTR